MAAADYKYVILGGGQAAGYTAREVRDLLDHAGNPGTKSWVSPQDRDHPDLLHQRRKLQ